MSEWRKVQLNEVVSILGDGLHGTPNFDDRGDYYFINGNNLSNGKIMIKPDTRKTTFEEYTKYKKNINERTILLSINGTLGNIAYYNGEKCILGKSACYLNILDTVNKDYIRYVLTDQQFQNYIDVFAHGTTIKNVSLKTIRDYPFLLPPLTEQKAIASVLSSLDDKIDLLHRQNKTLEAMAEALFRQLFVEEQKEIWKIGKIKELVNILSGFPFKSSSFIEVGKYQLITIKAVQDGQLNLVNADMINDIPSNMPDYCFLEIGDILLSLTGNVGRSCLVDTENLLLNQRVAKLHPKNARDWALAYFLFRQPHIKSSLEEMAKGTAQANLSPVETSNMDFIIPDENTLQEFSFIATPWLQKIIFNKKSIRTIVSVRNTLLPKLMSGEVRVAV